MNDVQASQVQVFHGVPHGRSQARRAGPFDFEAEPLPAHDGQKIEFTPRVSCPEVTFLGPNLEPADKLTDDETLP